MPWHITDTFVVVYWHGSPKPKGSPALHRSLSSTGSTPNYRSHITAAVCNLIMLLLLSRRFNSVMSRININSSLWILSILTSALWDPSHSVKLSSCDVREGQSSNRLHLDCSNRNLKEIPRDLHNTGVVSADLSRNIFKVSILSVRVPSNWE